MKRRNLLFLSICLAAGLAFAASNSQMAESAFHKAAALYFQQKDQLALEQIRQALALDPNHEPSQKLKTLIEAQLQKPSPQPSPEGSPGPSPSPQPGPEGSPGASPSPQAQGSPGATPPPDPNQQQPGQTPSPQPQSLDGEGTPSPQPTASPAPGASAAGETTPTASPGPQETQTPGAPSASDGSQATPTATVNIQQLMLMLNSVNEDEKAQIRARPLKVYGEQQDTGEDW